MVLTLVAAMGCIAHPCHAALVCDDPIDACFACPVDPCLSAQASLCPNCNYPQEDPSCCALRGCPDSSSNVAVGAEGTQLVKECAAPPTAAIHVVYAASPNAPPVLVGGHRGHVCIWKDARGPPSPTR